jgi:hypothetical protein
MELHDLLTALLPYLSPSEQAVYLRLWHLARGTGSCAVRYQDLCRAAAVSRSTLKRALKTLAQKKLVTVTWHAKRASLFQVWERKLAPTGRIDRGFAQARLYDLFSEEDRSLFLSTKRSLSGMVKLTYGEATQSQADGLEGAHLSTLGSEPRHCPPHLEACGHLLTVHGGP